MLDWERKELSLEKETGQVHTLKCIRTYLLLKVTSTARNII